MNAELYDKTYKLPSDVLNHIQTALTTTPNGDGVRRAKFLLKNGSVTYQVLKRLKNFFDHYNGEASEQYELAGGDPMKIFVEKTLQTDRDGVKRSKKIKRDMTVDVNMGMRPQENPTLNESSEDDLQKNALAIVVNNDNQILLLKRSPNVNWSPNKWALVGGVVEDGEDVLTACKREIKEETGLNIDKFRQKYTISRNPDSVEHIFIAKYDDDPEDIELNWEHTHYGWFTVDQIKFLDHVVNLIDYINLAFKDYE